MTEIDRFYIRTAGLDRLKSFCKLQLRVTSFGAKHSWYNPIASFRARHNGYKNPMARWLPPATCQTKSSYLWYWAFLPEAAIPPHSLWWRFWNANARVQRKLFSMPYSRLLSMPYSSLWPTVWCARMLWFNVAYDANVKRHAHHTQHWTVPAVFAAWSYLEGLIHTNPKHQNRQLLRHLPGRLGWRSKVLAPGHVQGAAAWVRDFRLPLLAFAFSSAIRFCSLPWYVLTYDSGDTLCLCWRYLFDP